MIGRRYHGESIDVSAHVLQLVGQLKAWGERKGGFGEGSDANNRSDFKRHPETLLACMYRRLYAMYSNDG